MIQIKLDAPLLKLTSSQLARHLINQPKTEFGTITIRDLMLNDQWIDQRIFDVNEQAAFGYGVYVFFVEEKKVYVGKVVSNFKHRMLSHQAFDNRVNFGFNKLAKYLYENETKLQYDKSEKKDFEKIVLPLMRKTPIVLLNCSGSSLTTKDCDRLERLVTKGFFELGYEIVSNNKRVSKYHENKSLEQLLSLIV